MSLIRIDFLGFTSLFFSIREFPTKSDPPCSYPVMADLGCRQVRSMSHAKLVGLVYLIGAVAGSGGCGGKVRYPSYYVLNVPPPAPEPAPPKPVAGSAAVLEFSAPKFLRAGPIVYRQSPEQLGFYNYDRWAVDPRSTLTNAFLATLQSRGVFQSVNMFDGRGASDYLVTGTLDHLEEVDQGKQVFINVAVSAQLADLKAGSVIWRDTSSETAKSENRAIPGLVAGVSQAADRAITQRVSSMQSRLLQLQPSASASLREPRPE